MKGYNYSGCIHWQACVAGRGGFRSTFAVRIYIRLGQKPTLHQASTYVFTRKLAIRFGDGDVET